MDYIQKIEELKSKLEQLAIMRGDDALLGYVQEIDMTRIDPVVAVLYIGTLTSYFENLELFSEEERIQLGLCREWVHPSAWRTIKMEWAE